MTVETLLTVAYDPSQSVYWRYSTMVRNLIQEHLAAGKPFYLLRCSGGELQIGPEYDPPTPPWERFGLSTDDIVGEIVAATPVGDSGAVKLSIRPQPPFHELFAVSNDDLTICSAQNAGELAIGLTTTAINRYHPLTESYSSKPVEIQFAYVMPAVDRQSPPRDLLAEHYSGDGVDTITEDQDGAKSNL